MAKILGDLFIDSTGEVNISFILSIIATTISLASIYIHYSNYIEKKAKIKFELLPIRNINRQICFSLYSNNNNDNTSLICDKNKYSAILHTRIINKSEKPIYIIEFIFRVSSKEVYLFNKNSYNEVFMITKSTNNNKEVNSILSKSNDLRIANTELLKPIIKLNPYEVIEGYIKFAPLPEFDIISPTIIMKTSRKNIKVRIGSIDFNSHYISLLDLCK